MCISLSFVSCVLVTCLIQQSLSLPHKERGSMQTSGGCSDFPNRCCFSSLSSLCRVGTCFCDPSCHISGDCCDDIGCPVRTCAHARLPPGCCDNNNCRVSTCYCDHLCFMYGDCCDDVTDPPSCRMSELQAFQMSIMQKKLAGSRLNRNQDELLLEALVARMWQHQ